MSLDLAPMLLAMAHWLFIALGIAGAAWLRSHVNNETARSVLTAALTNGVAMGFNMVSGALAGQPVNIDLGSKIAAQALKYVLDVAGKEAAHLGLDSGDLAKRIIARIPGLDGEVPADLIDQVVHAATGQKPVAMPSTVDFIAALGPIIEQMISARMAATPVPERGAAI